jgi:3-oxoacyl-[acyl-carrier protein] reductase
MVQKTLERFKRIDILVNNAGINQSLPIWEVSEETWNLIINVNLTATFRCTQAVLPTMMRQRNGVIINMSSIEAYMCLPVDGAAYASAKAGVIAFTKEIAKELGPYNIRVNAIAPGVIWNEYFEKHVHGSLKKDIEIIKKETPMGRYGTPEEVANTVVFLASDKASFTSGAIISITGGYNTW